MCETAPLTVVVVTARTQVTEAAIISYRFPTLDDEMEESRNNANGIQPFKKTFSDKLHFCKLITLKYIINNIYNHDKLRYCLYIGPYLQQSTTKHCNE